MARFNLRLISTSRGGSSIAFGRPGGQRHCINPYWAPIFPRGSLALPFFVSLHGEGAQERAVMRSPAIPAGKRILMGILSPGSDPKPYIIIISRLPFYCFGNWVAAQHNGILIQTMSRFADALVTHTVVCVDLGWPPRVADKNISLAWETLWCCYSPWRRW